MKKNIVYVGLGSNIKKPCQQIKQAIAALNELPETTVLRDSGYYKSRPMGPKDQPDYINAVVQIETTIVVIELLKCCQQIELLHGRKKLRHWGERTIDLDILLYADLKLNTDILTVPHPGILQRDFVYLPMLNINPDVNIPGIGLLTDAVKYIEKNKTDYGCQFAGSIE